MLRENFCNIKIVVEQVLIKYILFELSFRIRLVITFSMNGNNRLDVCMCVCVIVYVNTLSDLLVLRRGSHSGIGIG